MKEVLMEKRRKVILDVDTGSDDAVAIMTALRSRELEVLGITTVHGNLPLAYTTDNTLRVVELLGADVPVYAGCPYPLAGGATRTRSRRRLWWTERWWPSTRRPSPCRRPRAAPRRSTP